MKVEELKLTRSLELKLKMKKIYDVSDLQKLMNPDFDAKLFTKRDFIELFSIFYPYREILVNYEQSHADDQALIADMDKRIKKLEEQQSELVKQLEKADDLYDRLQWKHIMSKKDEIIEKIRNRREKATDFDPPKRLPSKFCDCLDWRDMTYNPFCEKCGGSGSPR